MLNRSVIILIIFTFCIIASNDKEKINLRKQYNFARKSLDHFEGFSKSIGDNDFTYSSLRNDVSDALLTRCTEGNMSIEWLTETVPSDYKKGAWFTWLAAIDLTTEQNKFSVFVNDIKRFTFISGTDEDKYFDGSDGGKLEYITIQKDQHNDSHGYMSMYAPAEWITPGEPLRIKIVGNAEGKPTWIIIFKATDALGYLHESVKYETWLKVQISTKPNSSEIKIIAPINYVGSNLKYKIGKEEGEFRIVKGIEQAEGQFTLSRNIINDSFLISDENDELIQLENLRNEIKKQRLLSNSLLINEIKKDGSEIEITVERIFQPNTVKNLIKLSKSKLSDGKIFLMNSSHQDIAWMDTPEKCVIERDTMLLTPLYEKAMTSDPSYRFDVEDALMIKEFIQRHPDKKDGITQLLNEGKISCGSNFIQPYEEMYSGEALVRQFYFGKKWLKKEFNYDAKVYWNVDVPGRVLQMPQILKKSGTDYMVISRHEKGLFNWYSPDGSFITTYTPGHYSNSYGALHKNVYEAANFLAEFSLDWDKLYTQKSPNNIAPILSDWDMSPAKDYSHIIDNWESISQLQKSKNEVISIELPKFKIATADEFFENITKSADNISSIKGERPAVWLYIHGPSHYQALKASREGDINLTVAEKFATIDALASKSFSNYPSERLAKAWESKIYPDHGWGGKGGDITDNLFLSKFVFANNEAKQIIELSTRSLASRVSTETSKGIPIIVFNSLSWERTDPAMFNLSFDEDNIFSLSLFDANGNEYSIQLNSIIRNNNGSIRSANLNFIADHIPATGYKTFYVKTSSENNEELEFVEKESKYYRIDFGNGGLKSIYDKELQKEILDVSKFLGGDIFTMHSEGNGAGEFADIQQPTMKGFDKTSNYETNWKLIENGPVFSLFKIRQQIRNAIVEQSVILYKEIKQIDFETSLLNWDGTLYREFRFALPINMNDGTVAYETAFGVSEVGKDEIIGAAGERYTTECKDIHPRGIENWIGVNNNDFGVTLSSCVAVADYIDPTDNPVNHTVLQPLLLASRRSCHGEGNEYLQTGDHHFKFSFTSHNAGWKNGFEFGKEANERLLVVVNPNSIKDANLEEEKSFFSVGENNAIISTIKKCEDDNGIIVRLYDILGTETDLKLNSFQNIQDAYMTNLIEEPIKKINHSNENIKIKLGHYSIETIKLMFK